MRHTRDCGAGGGAVAGEWLKWLESGGCGGGWGWLGVAGVAEAVVAARVRGRV